MILPEVPGVASGPSDPDPKPPDPKALLVALRAGAVVIDDHVQVDGLDRWLVVDPAMGWLLVDAPVIDRVRLDAWTLSILRACEPIRGSNFVDVPRRGRFAIRPVLGHDGGETALYVGLAAS